MAEEIGYRANPLARALPTGKTSLLALVVSDVTNPFYFEIIRGAEIAATEADYTLLWRTCTSRRRAERKALDVRSRSSRGWCWARPACRTRRSG